MADAMTPLTMTPEREAELRKDEPGALAWGGPWGRDLRSYRIELDATRAKLAEAEAQRNAIKAGWDAGLIEYAAERDKRHAAESALADAIEVSRSHADAADAAEARVAALTEALRACVRAAEKAQEASSDAGYNITDDKMAHSAICDAYEDGTREVVRAAMLALSPSRDAKG